MTAASAATLLHGALLIALELVAPLLGMMTATAIVFGILQAATQVQDATISFTPKLAVAFVVIWLLAAWMLSSLGDFMHQTLNAIPSVVMR